MIARWTTAVLLTAAALAGTPGDARKPRDSSARDQLEQVRQCKAIADPAARVACYDRAADGGPASGEAAAAAVPRAAPAPVVGRLPGGTRVVTKADDPVRSFGLEEVKEGRPQRDRIEPTREIVGRVVNVVPSVLGYETFVLDNGMRWQMVEVTESRLPKAGDDVTIRRGAVGGYFLNLQGRASVRVTRRL